MSPLTERTAEIKVVEIYCPVERLRTAAFQELPAEVFRCQLCQNDIHGETNHEQCGETFIVLAELVGW